MAKNLKKEIEEIERNDELNSTQKHILEEKLSSISQMKMNEEEDEDLEDGDDSNTLDPMITKIDGLIDQHKVILFGQKEDCVPCKASRQLLEEQGIPYFDIYLDEEPDGHLM